MIWYRFPVAGVAYARSIYVEVPPERIAPHLISVAYYLWNSHTHTRHKYLCFAVASCGRKIVNVCTIIGLNVVKITLNHGYRFWIYCGHVCVRIRRHWFKLGWNYGRQNDRKHWIRWMASTSTLPRTIRFAWFRRIEPFEKLVQAHNHTTIRTIRYHFDCINVFCCCWCCRCCCWSWKSCFIIQLRHCTTTSHMIPYFHFVRRVPYRCVQFLCVVRH